ncbi:hypothetical protein PG988_005858 [Apiospora saccharicola]
MGKRLQGDGLRAHLSRQQEPPAESPRLAPETLTPGPAGPAATGPRCAQDLVPHGRVRVLQPLDRVRRPQRGHDPRMGRLRDGGLGGATRGRAGLVSREDQAAEPPSASGRGGRGVGVSGTLRGGGARRVPAFARRRPLQ